MTSVSEQSCVGATPSRIVVISSSSQIRKPLRSANSNRLCAPCSVLFQTFATVSEDAFCSYIAISHCNLRRWQRENIINHQQQTQDGSTRPLDDPTIGDVLLVKQKNKLKNDSVAMDGGRCSMSRILSIEFDLRYRLRWAAKLQGNVNKRKPTPFLLAQALQVTLTYRESVCFGTAWSQSRKTTLAAPQTQQYFWVSWSYKSYAITYQ